jgi:Xaa-Pro aminopeptidase
MNADDSQPPFDPNPIRTTRSGRTTRSARTTRRGALALGAGLSAGLAFPACRSSGASPAQTADRRAELDALFADLRDARPDFQPIGGTERAARRARLGRLLAEAGLDAFVCEGGPTLTYLSGVGWGRSERVFALVLLADGSHFWICPAFEIERARLQIEGGPGSGERDAAPGGEIVAWQEHEYAWGPLAAALRSRRANRVGIDPGARFFVGERLRSELGADRVVSAEGVARSLRAVKDPHEVQLLRAASELTQRALAAVAPHVTSGMDGARISELVRHAQRRLGLESPWDLTLIGPAAAYPHGDEMPRALGRGDFVLIDTGGAFHGYQSDTSRTWAPEGEPRARELEAWHAVRDAQQRAFEAVRPGAVCSAVDRAARESFQRQGWGSGYEHFTHRLGHGIGLEGHEDPYFDGGSEVALAPGMTLTDEPGLYFYGEFGVRLEDVVLVTPEGADHFGRWQAGPKSPE